MSLYSEWLTDMDNMNITEDKLSSIHGGQDQSTNDADYLESLMDPTRKNQWKCTMMPWAGSRVSPTTTHLRQYLKTNVQYRNQDTSSDWGWGSYYIGTRECWLYLTQDYSVSVTWYTDDEGALFLNGNQIATSASCTRKTSTLNFKKGLNHLMITFSEQSNGDGAYMTTNPFTMSYVKWGYACFKS